VTINILTAFVLCEHWVPRDKIEHNPLQNWREI